MAIEEAQTFDVRLSLNAAVISDTAPPSLSGSETFQRRRVKGCPALQTKAYKNLLGGGERNRRVVLTQQQFSLRYF